MFFDFDDDLEEEKNKKQEEMTKKAKDYLKQWNEVNMSQKEHFIISQHDLSLAFPGFDEEQRK